MNKNLQHFNKDTALGIANNKGLGKPKVFHTSSVNFDWRKKLKNIFSDSTGMLNQNWKVNASPLNRDTNNLSPNLKNAEISPTEINLDEYDLKLIDRTLNETREGDQFDILFIVDQLLEIKTGNPLVISTRSNLENLSEDLASGTLKRQALDRAYNSYGETGYYYLNQIFSLIEANGQNLNMEGPNKNSTLVDNWLNLKGEMKENFNGIKYDLKVFPESEFWHDHKTNNEDLRRLNPQFFPSKKSDEILPDLDETWKKPSAEEIMATTKFLKDSLLPLHSTEEGIEAQAPQVEETTNLEEYLALQDSDYQESIKPSAAASTPIAASIKTKLFSVLTLKTLRSKFKPSPPANPSSALPGTEEGSGAGEGGNEVGGDDGGGGVD